MGSETAPEFVVLIPARLASSRLPRKALADIAGEPMVVHVARRAMASGAKRVAVATDSAEIHSVVVAAGFEALMTRQDHASGTDRIAEAADAIGLPDDTLVVNVQGDEPQMPPTLIGQVARALAADPGAAMSTAAHPISAANDWFNPNVVKVVTDARARALLFSRAPIPFARDTLGSGAAIAAAYVECFGAGTHASATSRDAAVPQSLTRSGLPLRHIGIYAYRKRFLSGYGALPRSPLEDIEALEQLRALCNGHAIAVTIAPQAPAAGIDTPEDLERVRRDWRPV